MSEQVCTREVNITRQKKEANNRCIVTQVEMDAETVRFQKLPDSVHSGGHQRLPSRFYESTFYGLSAMNPAGQRVCMLLQ